MKLTFLRKRHLSSSYGINGSISRHKERSYATDSKAQSVVMKALYHNYHRIVSPLQAIFLPCLVLTHSEHFHHQV